jgi:hypothetical protein
MNTMNNGGTDLLALFAEVEADIAAGTAPVYTPPAYIIAAEARAANPCGKCRGTGHIERYRHISGGNCFACGGDGIAE